MINYNVDNPMGSFFNTVQGFQKLNQNQSMANTANISNQLKAQKQQYNMERQDRIDNEKRQLRQDEAETQKKRDARIQELLPLVKAGDYDATVELTALDPNTASAVEKANKNLKQGQDKEISDWLIGYQTAPDKDAYISQDIKGVDIDDRFRSMDLEQRDSVARIVGAQVMPKSVFEATFSSGPKEPTQLQQAQIENKEQDTAIKKEKYEAEKEEKRQKVEEKRREKEEEKAQDKQRIDDAIFSAKENQRVIDELLGNDDYMDSISGLLNYSKVPEAARTPNQVEAAAFLENIKNSMTIDNLDAMSGPLTDSDIKIIAAASSRLMPGMSKKALKKELNIIKNAYARVIKNYKKEANRKGYDKPAPVAKAPAPAPAKTESKAPAAKTPTPKPAAKETAPASNDFSQMSDEELLNG